MAISYPLTMPTSVKYATITLHENNLVASTQSIFTGEQYHVDYGGKFWVADISCPPMKTDSAAEWEGFLSGLHGKVGTFKLPFLQRTAPRGVATGAPVVDGAGQTGTTLNTRGWTISTTGILKVADYLEISDYAYKVVASDVNSDGTGDAAIEIWPNLRTSPADGTTINVNNVDSLFRLASNDLSFSVDSAQIFGFKFTAVEAI